MAWSKCWRKRVKKSSGFAPPATVQKTLRLGGILAGLVSLSAVSQSMSLPPHLVLVNATIRTMDTNRSRAEAVAVLGKRIVAVGLNDEIRRLAGPGTRVIDAGRKLLLPGFNDAHVHFLSGGFQLSGIDLRSAKSPDEFSARLRNFAAKVPRARWITGGDWDHESWPDTPLPTREMVDAATTNNPVFVHRLDGHMALANSLALRMAGITRDTKDPDGGTIVRDAKTGEPTGLLKDAAMSFVYRIIPSSTLDRKSTRLNSSHVSESRM